MGVNFKTLTIISVLNVIIIMIIIYILLDISKFNSNKIETINKKDLLKKEYNIINNKIDSINNQFSILPSKFWRDSDDIKELKKLNIIKDSLKYELWQKYK